VLEPDEEDEFWLETLLLLLLPAGTATVCEEEDDDDEDMVVVSEKSTTSSNCLKSKTPASSQALLGRETALLEKNPKAKQQIEHRQVSTMMSQQENERDCRRALDVQRITLRCACTNFTISILCREHNCIEVKLWPSTKTKEVVRNSASLSLCDKGITPSRHRSNCGVQAYPNHPELMELQLVVCTLRHRNREDSGSDFFLTQISSSDAQRTHGKKFLGRKNRNTKKFCTKFFLRNWILFHRAQQNFRSKLVRQQRRQRN
jgi:hypothetical protein